MESTLEKLENRITDEERKISTKRNCASQSSKDSQDAVERHTRYWQRFENKNNASHALMTSQAKNCRDMKCAKLVQKN